MEINIPPLFMYAGFIVSMALGLWGVVYFATRKMDFDFGQFMIRLVAILAGAMLGTIGVAFHYNVHAIEQRKIAHQQLEQEQQQLDAKEAAQYEEQKSAFRSSTPKSWLKFVDEANKWHSKRVFLIGEFAKSNPERITLDKLQEIRSWLDRPLPDLSHLHRFVLNPFENGEK